MIGWPDHKEKIEEPDDTDAGGDFFFDFFQPVVAVVLAIIAVAVWGLIA